MKAGNALRCILAGTGLIVATGMSATPCLGQAGTHRVAVRDMICGPRAVEFILYWYGKPEEVSDLIWELQGGDVSRPVNLQTIADALGKRQIHTKAIRLSPGTEPEWPYPSILHLNQAGGPGHFVVRVPAKDGRPVLYWSGTSGYGTDLREEARNNLTGVVLLTSLEPIPDTVPVTTRASVTTNWFSVAGVVFAGVIGLWALIGRRRSACRTHLKEE